jgi:hypothetical protein
MPVVVGKSFTLRENRQTVGTGIVTKLLPALKTTNLDRRDLLKMIEVPGVKGVVMQ